MKAQIEIKKLNLVQVPAEFQKEEGCIAFQMVELSYSFYGSLMTERFDTKILPNGKQLVINGNGFIKDNFEIN
jgi:hypothetical protein